MLKKFLLPIILLVLAYGFWISPNFKAIAAGVAIFLFGMLSLEQGFQAFTGGGLERLLRRTTSGVRVAGVDNLMVSFARCCQPIPGDSIVGVITRGRGVSVHRAGCTNLSDPNLGPERLIDVVWDSAPDQTFMVKLIITANDRNNLLMDISNVISLTNTNISSGEFSAEDDLAKVTLVVEVKNLNSLEKILKAIRKVRGVQNIERFQLGGGPVAGGDD